ncbi:MAG: hypothetical protein ABJF11_07535 [Reichenbachiella sp.]|uniref:hypothetical protein n=1 Tax=Reichenbachiella sp. TaxID=2184521 RepID=UPI003267D138
MEKIKLVIWDLDETFWNGTLSEEGISPLQYNIDLVKELSRRGIINSIVSKNDFQNAKQKLIELGVWEFFVFPQIDWTPKGLMVKKLIELAQLRPVNCLFLDDNYLNLEEVQFYNEKINAKDPEFIPEILGHSSFQGKNDEQLERLNHYKILEQKSSDSENFSDNSQFLKQSEIKVHIGNNIDPNFDRIIELIERTNQLNYTKLRIGVEELKSYNSNPDYKQGYVEVSDRYGYYGIIGYYCLDTKNHKLVHFVFSCRTLNLGVEQFVYSKLGFPKLEVVGEVATELDQSAPDWISETHMDHNSQVSLGENKLKVILRGGCDLRQILHYLSGYNIEFIEETNGVSPTNIAIHAEHTQYLADQIRLSQETRNEIIRKIPFVFPQNYLTRIFDNDIDLVIYSVLMDYRQFVYHNPNEGYKVCHGGAKENWTDPKQIQHIVDKYTKLGAAEIKEEYLSQFRENHINIGLISPQEFLSNLEVIRKSSKAKIVFINGSEIDPLDDKTIEARHKEMNLVLEQFVAENNNCYLLDVRKIIHSKLDMNEHIRHYKRHVYEQMAKNLVAIFSHAGYNFDENQIGLSFSRKLFNKLNNKKVKKFRRVMRKLFKS